MTTTTYLGSGDANRLADDVPIEGSVLTGIVEGLLDG
jgi:hypothetical protein